VFQVQTSLCRSTVFSVISFGGHQWFAMHRVAGKNKIELFRALPDEFKNIRFNNPEMLQPSSAAVF